MRGLHPISIISISIGVLQIGITIEARRKGYSRLDWDGDVYYPNPHVNVSLMTLSPDNNRRVPSHECDSVYVTDSDEDGCPEIPGCEHMERERMSHTFFGVSTYFCSGQKRSDDKTECDRRVIVYGGDTAVLVQREDLQLDEGLLFNRVATIIAGYNTKLRAGSDGFDYIQFVNYSNGGFGVLADDCFYDKTYTLQNAAKGFIYGTTYVYSADGGGEAGSCDEKASRRNYDALCGNLVPQSCMVRFSPMYDRRKYIDRDRFVDTTEDWRDRLPYCNVTNYYNISSVLGFQKQAFPGTIRDEQNLIPCRLRGGVHKRSIAFVKKEHGYFHAAIHALLSGMNYLFVRIVEPVLMEILNVIVTLFKTLVWTPVVYGFGFVLNSDKSFFACLGITVCMLWYIYRRIRKLTSPLVIVIDESFFIDNSDSLNRYKFRRRVE